MEDQVQARMRALLNLGLELNKAANFDDLCRMAVELGRERLGFDRLGLWFINEDSTSGSGSFGTDEQGNTRDERGEQWTGEATPLVVKGLLEKQIVVSDLNAPLYDGPNHFLHGYGWNATAMLWDGDQIIGYLSADNLLTKRPPTDADLEILKLYGTTLGYLCTRKRTEEALRASEESERHFQTRLKVLNEVSLELSKADSVDDLCRMAVEMGRSRLGFDRLGIWFQDEDHDYMWGSFGTDEEGNTRDEREMRLPSGMDIPLIREAFRTKTAQLFEDGPLFNHEAKPIATGWKGMALLRDGDRIIGTISTDNLIHRQPITDEDIEILSLYGSTLGHLCTKKRAEESLRANQQAEREFQERLKVLNEITLEMGKAASLDIACRIAVERGRQRLHFDRLSIWLLEDSGRSMVGTYGTDEDGKTRDEHTFRTPLHEDDPANTIADDNPVLIFQEQSLLADHTGKIVGQGWTVKSILLDGSQTIGILYCDNLLKRQPISNYDLELLRLYSTALGQICARKRAEESLVKERNLLRTLIDTLHDRIYVKDKQSRLLMVNRISWETVPGAAGEADLIGKTDYDFWPPEVAEAIVKAEQEMFRTGQPIINHEEPGNIQNGQMIYYLTTKIPLRDSQGNIIGLVGVSRDITERKLAEQERLALALQTERLQFLTEFISNLSHDLKTPLTTINTSLYLLERLDDPLRQKAKIETIKQQAQRLEKLIQSILTMSRLDSGIPVNFAPLQLNQILEDVAHEIRPAADEKQQHFSLHLMPDLPSINGNVEELWRLVMNLVENAIRYTPEGGSITAATFTTAEHVCLDIHDTGIGISDEAKPHIFDRFYRADAARSSDSGGSGLGLAIVKRIVEMHAGTITVTSHPGAGTCFHIALPPLSPLLAPLSL